MFASPGSVSPSGFCGRRREKEGDGRKKEGRKKKERKKKINLIITLSSSSPSPLQIMYPNFSSSAPLPILTSRLSLMGCSSTPSSAHSDASIVNISTPKRRKVRYREGGIVVGKAVRYLFALSCVSRCACTR